jgi:hypothetical protein
VRVRFTQYGVGAAVPTSLELPCEGRGTVKFTPKPKSADAVPDFVAVQFVGQP